MLEIIKLDNVCKNYEIGESVVKAICHVNIEIKKGDFVAIMGPSGSGKCVSADTEIILDNGIPLKIIDITSIKKSKILALNKKTRKVAPFPVSNFFKRKTHAVLEIKTTSGKNITVTKEHPFFTLSEKGFREISAKDLKKGLFVATLRKINIRGSSQYLNSLNKLSRDDSLIIFFSVPLVKKIFKEIKISRKEICKRLNFNLGTYDSWLQKNNISLTNLKNILEVYGKKITDYEKSIRLTALSSNKIVDIPKNTTPELLELYGIIVGDGNIDKSGIKITNIDPDLKGRIKYLTKVVFDLKTKECISERIDINSRVLRSFFNIIFEVPLIKKSRNIKLPNFVFKCSNEEISYFIKGLFDCDAHISKNKKEIVITLASKDLITQLNYLLLRFGIVARYSEKVKWASNTEQKNKRRYYSLSILNTDNLKLYKEYIGFNSKKKKDRLDKHLAKKANIRVDVIPCGDIIRDLKKNSGVMLTRKMHKLLWPYETKKTNPSIKRLKDIIKIFEDNKIDSTKLKEIVNSDIFWDEVSSIKKLNKEVFVYDVTIPGADNFVANKFIIHNSTMMNLVGALDLATQGEIFLDKQDIEHLSESELAQVRGKKVGFIFQSFNLIPNLTAKENIMLPMLFQDKDKDEREKKAEELLVLVGLTERGEHYPNQLSGGEQQRVAIARALANDPEVILADEPTGNLDSKTGKSILEIFKKLNKEGRTIIIVTHDTEIAKNAKIIYHLKDGKVEKVTRKR